MAAVSGKKAHVVAVAAPGQGHVKPLMSLCRQIAKHGIKVTFVNTQSTHEKIVGANSANTCTAEEDDNMVLASVPDGLGPNDNPNDILTLMEKLPSTLQESLPDLIERINTSNPNHKISCVIADLSFGWILDIAHKMGAQPVGFCAPSIASFAIARHIPNLIQQGYLDTNDKKPHVLAVPFPAQGHVKPLMKLSRQIAKHGIKVTFVNIECVHHKIVSSAKMSKEDQDVDVDEDEDNLVLASVGDGRSPEDDQNDVFKLLDTLRSSMPQSLMNLIETINSSTPNEKISCVIVDITMGWIWETAEKMGAEFVVFSPPSAAAIAIVNQIPKLLKEGVLDQNGSVRNGEISSLSDDMPVWGKDELSWSFPIDLKTQKIFFECSRRVEEAAAHATLVLSNTCYELEPVACGLTANFLPVGPLTLLDKNGPNSCNFHPEDFSCLSWLDGKPGGSVIYVSFGSLAVFSQQQLDELALGLEMSGRAFLWVVRSDLANGSRAVFPDGFLERVGELGKIVEWAPQERVLSHPSVACFLSHCGWNSTLEGLSRGLPFLCWPYFSDQFHNQKYICDKWEIGFRIDPDENGIRLRHEIKEKIDLIFGDDDFRKNALRVKEITGESVSEGGSSYKNLKNFIDHLWERR